MLSTSVAVTSFELQSTVSDIGLKIWAPRRESGKGICEWKDCEVLELNVMPDHVHMVVTFPPPVGNFSVDEECEK